MKFKLKKLSNNENKLRTNEVIGGSNVMPAVGEPFEIVGKPLEISEGMRVVCTSLVVSIEKTDNPQVQIIHTLNSVYEITLLQE